MKLRSMRLLYGTFAADDGNGGGSGGAGDAGGGSGDTGSGDWRTALPESVREWDEFKSSETPEAAFERIEHMRTKFGTGLFAPGEDASDKDWRDFYGKLSERTRGKVMPRPDADDAEAMDALYTQLGRPEDATAYEFVEGTDPDVAAAVGAIAHDNNLTVAQMKALDEGMAPILEAQKEAAKAQFDEGINTLKGEWGAAWDERSKVAEKVRDTFLKFIPSEGMNADTMAALYEVGKAMGGEGAQLLNQSNIAPEPTILEAKDQIEELSGRIAELQKEHDGAKRDELKRLVLKRRNLYKKAYPGGAVELGHGARPAAMQR